MCHRAHSNRNSGSADDDNEARDGKLRGTIKAGQTASHQILWQFHDGLMSSAASRRTAAT